MSDFIFYEKNNWDERTKEEYFSAKNNAKNQIYISFFVVTVLVLLSIIFNSDFLPGVALLALLVFGGFVIQFKGKYISFKNTEENDY